MRKAQSAMEFSLMTAFASIFIIILLVIAIAFLTESQNKKTDNYFDSFANDIQEEIIITSQMRDGYYSIINIPETINNHRYLLNNTETYFFIEYKNRRITRYIPHIEGRLRFGENTIKKENGKVIIT